MTRQSIFVILVMILTVTGSYMFTQYMALEREQVVQKEKAQQVEIARAASSMPRPAPERLSIGDITYRLTAAPRGTLTYRWLGFTPEKIGIYAVSGDYVNSGSVIAIKHDDGTYSFYTPLQ